MDDFIIHINNTILADEASVFVDSMEELGLKQHYEFITHKAGYTFV